MTLIDTQEKTPEKKESRPFINNTGNFDKFRYGLTILFVSIKLGLFAYLPTNPLAEWSWWLVLLPAYITEGVIAALLVLLGALAVVGAVIYLLYLTVRYIIERIRFGRSLKKPREDTVVPISATPVPGSQALTDLLSQLNLDPKDIKRRKTD
jgi:hypothetical protein